MDKEIEVPSFTNDRYYQRKEQEQVKRQNKVKVYKRLVTALAIGGLVIAARKPIMQATNVAIEKFIEHDNEMLDADYEYQKDETIEITGRTPEQIMESGKSK